jgi:predicted permease
MTKGQIKLIGSAVIAVALFMVGGAVAWFRRADAYGKVIATNEASHPAVFSHACHLFKIAKPAQASRSLMLCSQLHHMTKFSA